MKKFAEKFPELDPTSLQKEGTIFHTDDYCSHYWYKPTDRVYSYDRSRKMWLSTTMDVKKHMELFDKNAADRVYAEMMEEAQKAKKRMIEQQRKYIMAMKAKKLEDEIKST